MSTSSDTNAILVDISKTTDVARVDEGEWLHRSARERVMQLIDRFAKQARHWCGAPDEATFLEARVHNTIVVNGTRGSGKTTFIRNVFKSLAAETSPKQVYVLPIIDPTLVEDEENVLVTVIDMIVEACDDAIQHGGTRMQGQDLHQAFQKALADLADGISTLESVGGRRGRGSWEEPRHLLSVALRRSRSGTGLELAFRKFLEAALKVVGKSAFVLAFDDVDTQFERGWPVLETIRKYLTSPRLILLLTGDLDLYSKLVRGRQFENFGRDLLTNDRPRSAFHNVEDLPTWQSDPYVGLVDRLEDQYLQKVLKPENRVALLNLNQLLRASRDRYLVTWSGRKGPPLEIAHAVDNLIANATLQRDPADLAIARNVVLSQPLRTVIQFLKAGEDVLAGGVADADPNFRDKMTDVFASALYRQRVDPMMLIGSDSDTLIAQMASWLESSKIWDTGYRMRPEHDDNSRNLTALALSAQFASALDGAPGVAFGFMIKIGLVRELATKGDSFAIMRYVGLDTRERSTNVARRCVAVQRVLGRQNGPVAGSIPVAGTKIDKANMLRHLYIGKRSSREGDPSHAFNGGLDQLTSTAMRRPYRPILAWWQQAEPRRRKMKNVWKGHVYNTFDGLGELFGGRSKLANLAACIVTRPRQQDTIFLSIFCLLGAIAELLELVSLEGEGFSERSLRLHFVRLTQLRSYPSPNLPGSKQEAAPTRRVVVKDDESDDESLEDETGDNSLASMDFLDNMFVRYMRAWLLKHFKESVRLPPMAYGRMATRLFYTLERMDSAVGPQEEYLGALLHRQIVALFNSVLVEELTARRSSFDESRGSREPTLDNPTSDDTPFWRNFPFTGEQSDGDVEETIDMTNVPFFALLFSCPLWALFLSPYVTIIKGSRRERWDLLNLQIKSWPTTSDGLADSTATRQAAVGVVEDEMSFPNLWAPLNSVPVLKAAQMDRNAWDSIVKTAVDALPELKPTTPSQPRVVPGRRASSKE